MMMLGDFQWEDGGSFRCCGWGGGVAVFLGCAQGQEGYLSGMFALVCGLEQGVGSRE